MPYLKGLKMKNAELHKKLAHLESMNDVLITEIENIHELMKMIGFANGINTLKTTAEGMIYSGYGNVSNYYN
ncbi:Uncharacterized protein DB41_EC00030 [Neochlamydia sp. TUME1]|nr:Uncharacterized protein DB41_EC00030 [Neochlamydia sp. TUME1]